MAAYADHGLSLAERARVETHLASCPQCTALLAGVVRTVAEVSALMPHAELTAEATPSIARRAAVGALTAAAAVIAIVAAPSLVGPWLERDAGLVSLVDSVGEQRSVLGRLTGGFPHAPLGVPPAGGQGGRAAGTDRVLLTAGKIRESFGDWETPSRLHTLGVAQLLAGRYDDAAQSLLAASREQPANAQYLSDLATVQLERARLGLRPDDLPRALAAADRARRLDPSLREAWFNRALAATALSLTDQAKTAWTEYLKRDSVSPWASEARARLEELSKPTPAAAWTSIEGRLQQSIDPASADEAVRTQTTEARNYIENVLFVEWADAVLSGGTGSAELERLRVMAEAMLRVAGDALYRDAVSAIDFSGTRGHLRTLAEVHQKYAAASRLLSEDRFAEAASGLRDSSVQFASMESPFAKSATLGITSIDYIAGRYVQADRVLTEVQTSADAKGYLYTTARATWLRGMTAFAQSRLGDAQNFYDLSLSTFERMGDVEGAGGAHILLSGVAYQLGDDITEWRHRRAALDALAFSRSPRFKYQALVPAAISTRRDSPEAALAILDSVLAAAKEWGREGAIADALAQRSATLLTLGRTNEATEAVAEARQRVQRVPDPAFRSMLELPVLAVESDLLRASNPSEAAAVAQRAIATVESRGDRSRLPQFALRLAKANIVWGKLAEAEAALIAGISAFDYQRSKMTDESGVSAHDESWQLFETAVRLAIRRGDHDRAFAMAERARAISLVEHRTGAIPTLTVAQAAARPDEAIVVLNQFEDELAIWVIRKQKTVVVMRPVERVHAQRLVARQQEEIRLELTNPSAGASLFDAVLRPISAHLEGVARIVFVPDATYRALSFAALFDRSKQRFLVEDVGLSATPSVATFAAFADSSAMMSTPRRVEGDRALIVATGYEEPTARAIAGEYRAADVLTGVAATRTRFLADAPSNSIVHLALPTFANAAYPLLSRVIFNDEPGRPYSGVVLASDIAARPMPATRLVVLDEVRSEQRYRTAGTFNLARAFLAAGVPAVLGTLPGADEDATRELMVGFHREMAGQASAADALTRLQRNVLQQNGRRLGAWSALVLYGSDR